MCSEVWLPSILFIFSGCCFYRKYMSAGFSAMPGQGHWSHRANRGSLKRAKVLGWEVVEKELVEIISFQWWSQKNSCWSLGQSGGRQMPGEHLAAIVVDSAVCENLKASADLLAVPATSHHPLCKKKKWERNGLPLLFNKHSKISSFTFSTLTLETPSPYSDSVYRACVYVEFRCHFFQQKRARGARTVFISECGKSVIELPCSNVGKVAPSFTWD